MSESARPVGRRRQIQRAIWRREEPPEGMRELAMQVAIRQVGLRWVLTLYAIGIVAEVVVFFTEKSSGARLRDVVLALAFLGLGYYQHQVSLRAAEALVRWSAE